MKTISSKSVMLATAIFASLPFMTAYGPSSQSIGITANVPLLCRVDFNGGNVLAAGDGPVTLGQTDEFCNSARGYRLIAMATGQVDGASLIVNGTTYPLSPGDSFPLVNSNNPDKTARAIVYNPGSSAGGGNLSLQIVAK